MLIILRVSIISKLLFVGLYDVSLLTTVCFSIVKTHDRSQCSNLYTINQSINLISDWLCMFCFIFQWKFGFSFSLMSMLDVQLRTYMFIGHYTCTVIVIVSRVHVPAYGHKHASNILV